MSLCRLRYCRRPRKNVIGEKYAKDDSTGDEGKIGKAAIFAMADDRGDTGDGGCDNSNERHKMTD